MQVRNICVSNDVKFIFVSALQYCEHLGATHCKKNPTEVDKCEGLIY